MSVHLKARKSSGKHVQTSSPAYFPSTNVYKWAKQISAYIFNCDISHLFGELELTMV